MSYLEEIPSCLLNIILLELKYNDVYNLILSKMVNNELLDYKSLFYSLDEMFYNSNIQIIKQNLPLYNSKTSEEKNFNIIEFGNTIQKTMGGIHLRYKELLNKEGVNKFLFDYDGNIDPYKVLYFILLKRDKYKKYLDDKVTLYLDDKILYNLVSSNKTYIENYDFEFLNYKINLNVIELNKFIVFVRYEGYVNVEHLLRYSYMDTINDITKYVKDTYNLSRYGLEFSTFLENSLKNPLLEKYVLNYFKYLIEYYPSSIEFYQDVLMILSFYELSKFDMVDFILSKMINEKNGEYFTNIVECLENYFMCVIDNANNSESNEGDDNNDFNEDDIKIDYRLIKYIIKYLKNKIKEQPDLENIFPLTELEELKDKLKEYLDK